MRVSRALVALHLCCWSALAACSDGEEVAATRAAATVCAGCDAGAPPPRCGDGSCDFAAGEDCDSCVEDCSTPEVYSMTVLQAGEVVTVEDEAGNVSQLPVLESLHAVPY